MVSKTQNLLWLMNCFFFFFFFGTCFYCLAGDLLFPDYVSCWELRWRRWRRRVDRRCGRDAKVQSLAEEEQCLPGISKAMVPSRCGDFRYFGRWMVMDGYGWLWMVMDGYGWLWMVMDGYGWLWMVMDGYGWLWMVMISFCAFSLHAISVWSLQQGFAQMHSFRKSLWWQTKSWKTHWKRLQTLA